MFRVLDFPPDGAPLVSEGDSLVAPPPEGVIRWVDLEDQDEPQLAALKERFGFHPLALEDCAHFDQRAKLEEYGDVHFIVLHGISCANGDPTEIRLHEVHAFLGDRLLVTVHQDPIPALAAVWERARGSAPLGRRGSDFLHYLVIDAIVDAIFPVLDSVTDDLDDTEEAVLDGRAGREELERLFRLKHALAAMRRSVSPSRDVLALLSRRGDARISERSALYYRDVYDHLVRIGEAIDAGRDMLGNALDAYLSMASLRTNEIMKRLTILSAIFLPLTFITGFFGQNFEHLPFASDALMFSMLFACALVPTTMLFWFRRSGWF